MQYTILCHPSDLVIFLLGVPDNVTGSVLQSVYSSDVEDVVSTTFLYNNGISGSVLANWSDESFRKPTNRIELFGKKGKIIADQYSYKIFLKEDHPEHGFVKGWNTRYITDLAKSVRFDVRGRVYTRQLDNFIDCIEQERTDNISSFAEALKTDIIMDEIRRDAARSLASDNTEPLSTPDLTKATMQPSLWRKLLNSIGVK